MNVLIILLVLILLALLYICNKIKNHFKFKSNYTYSSTEKTTLNVSGIKVTKINGKVKITVDGRDVDPESEEGKRILNTTLAKIDLVNEEFKELGKELKKDMDEVFDEVSKTFKNIFK